MRLQVIELEAGYSRGRDFVPVIRAINAVVEAGVTLAVIGESGSGKSTLGKAIVGLAPIAKGRVLLDGVDVTQRRDRHFRASVQMVFQSPGASLNPKMTIGETLREAATLRRRSDVAARVAGLMDLTGLARDWTSRLPRELSGGQLQRVALARALALEPALIIADEITSALDPSVRAGILNLLDDIRSARPLGLMFITHDLGIARHIADRILVLRGGAVIETGPTAQVLVTPAHAYTAALLAAEPRLGIARS